MATKWGIISTGKISQDFARALSFLPSNEHEIIAVAARKKDDAVNFAKEFGIPNAFSTYDEIATDKTIEIVYIGSINTAHFTLCKMMLESGKNVLCEKPLCLKYDDTKELITLLKDKILMSGQIYEEVIDTNDLE